MDTLQISAAVLGLRSMVILATVTYQFNQMGMTQLPQKYNFRQPFPVALKTIFVENLHCNRQRLETCSDILIYITLIYSSKASFPQNIIRTETFGDDL
jgi:hypothetical protein